ncbi:MAG: hypothetical protein WB630_22610 [Candidatus Acidiferrales bacterium]
MRVKIRPVARRIDPNGFDLEQVDEAFQIEHTSRTELTLRSVRTGQGIVLGTDHVREFMSDGNIINKSDGYLILKSQVFLFAPRGFAVQPLDRRL